MAARLFVERMEFFSYVAIIGHFLLFSFFFHGVMYGVMGALVFLPSNVRYYYNINLGKWGLTD